MATLTLLAILKPAASHLPDKTLRKSSTAIYREDKTRRIADCIDKKDFSNAELPEPRVSDLAAVSGI